ncbi:hypothetical protein V8E36_006328 [Tilletia maclaganii]
MASTAGEQRYYLAVDCGGTKAAAAIASSHPTPGTLLGLGLGGPSNYTDIATGHFLRNVRSAIEDACFQANIITKHDIPHHLRLSQAYRRYTSDDNTHGQEHRAQPPPTSTAQTSTAILEPHTFSIHHYAQQRRSPIDLSTLGTPSADADEIPLPHFDAAWFAVAGVDSAGDVDNLKPHLFKMLKMQVDEEEEQQSSPSTARARLVVANDTSLLAAPLHESASSATEEQTAVVVIAGTGSIVTSFRRDEHVAGGGAVLQPIGRSGGFGWLLGDEGSGFAVGREAIRRVLDRADRERLLAYDDGGAEGKGDDTVTAHASGLPNGSLHTSSKRKGRRRGHLLRDRILKYWDLRSTDDLLAAVYSHETPIPVWNHSRAAVGPGATTTASSSSAVSVHSDAGDEVEQGEHMVQTVTSSMLGSASTSEEQGGECSGQAGEKATGHLEAGLAGEITANSSFSVQEGHATEASRLTYEGAQPQDGPPETRQPDHGNTMLTPPGAIVNGTKASLLRIKPITPTTSTPAEEDASGPTSVPPPPSPLPIPKPGEDLTFVHKMGERKHRLASLATLVFELAFERHDRESLEILRAQARLLARQVLEVVQIPLSAAGPSPQASQDTPAVTPPAPPPASPSNNHRRPPASASTRLGRVDPARSVLCTGGSLLGVAAYRQMLEEECGAAFRFRRTVYVDKPASTGAMALAQMWERDRHQVLVKLNSGPF